MRVLRLPAVADKTFLITIGDRTVGGMVSRDPLVGPWQVPVSDVAVTVADYRGHARRGDGDGRAHAGGGARCARLGAPRGGRGHHQHPGGRHRHRSGAVRLSANWMAACGEPGEDAALYETVRAVGKELCPALGIAIPVGKDSLSMRTSWRQDGAAAQRGRAGVAHRVGLRAGR